jgi:hypothetical protein
MFHSPIESNNQFEEVATDVGSRTPSNPLLHIGVMVAATLWAALIIGPLIIGSICLALASAAGLAIRRSA